MSETKCSKYRCEYCENSFTLHTTFDGKQFARAEHRTTEVIEVKLTKFDGTEINNDFGVTCPHCGEFLLFGWNTYIAAFEGRVNVDKIEQQNRKDTK